MSAMTGVERNAESASAFDPSLYPRTYRVSTVNRIFYMFLGACGSAAGLFVMVYFGTGHETNGPGERIELALFGGLILASGLYVIVFVLKTKLVLYGDRAEALGVKTTRSMLRADVSGWRVVPRIYFSSLVLLPRRPGMKKFSIMLLLQRDAAFDAWFASLPNLEAMQ